MTTLVRGAWVLTMEGVDGEGALESAAVAFEDERITAVGSFEDLRAAHPAAEVVRDGNGIVMPGFVNAHTHLTEGLIPGMGETASLWEWFERVVNPVAKVLNREEVRVGTRLRGAEMLLGGITTVNDMSCHRNLGALASLGAVDGLCELGLRGAVCFGAEDDYPGAPDASVFMAEHEALADRLAGEQRLAFRAGVGTVLGMTEVLLQRTVEECRANNWSVHTHLAEVREEMTASRARNGLTTIEHAAAIGLLDHDVIAGHCVWCSSRDISLLGAKQVAVAHNPVANMVLASGVCPLERLKREAITISLGTDGAASNDSQDMFGAVKAAALLQKVAALRADAITAPEVLRMATVEGARALGLQREVGSLEAGKRADVVLLDGDAVELATIHDPWQQIAYCATPRCVSHVWIDGEARVRAGELVGHDVAELVAEARRFARELAIRAGLGAESVYAGATPGGQRLAGFAFPTLASPLG